MGNEFHVDFKRPDESLLEDVCAMLEKDEGIDASRIDVDAKDGEITLKGAVKKSGEKELAGTIAESVFGVRNVKNEIRVVRSEQERKTGT